MNLNLVANSLVLVMLCSSMSLAEQPARADESGIEGVITISPTRGGPVRPDRPNSAPLREVEFAVRRGAEAVASFKTDAEGKFRVLLPPAHYTVVRADWNGRVGHYGPFEVNVTEGEITTVQWRCDSGMR